MWTQHQAAGINNKITAKRPANNEEMSWDEGRSKLKEQRSYRLAVAKA